MDGPPPLTRFTPGERRIITRLYTPEKVQQWIHRLPYNWEKRGETLHSFRHVVRRRRAHCLEAALCAATILEQHGHPPLLMDLESIDLLDHVLYPFQRNGKWGAVAGSRDPGLFGRKPVFQTLRDLVVSYAAPYIDDHARIKGYGVYDLRNAHRADWRLARGNQWWIQDALNENHHKTYRTPESYYQKWKRRNAAARKAIAGQTTDFPYRATWM